METVELADDCWDLMLAYSVLALLSFQDPFHYHKFSRLGTLGWMLNLIEVESPFDVFVWWNPVKNNQHNNFIIDLKSIFNKGISR